MDIFIFITGIVFGSFFNVVGIRVPKKIFLSTNRSKCLHCDQILSWKELIPLISYLYLKGKCRHCKKKISLMYPTAELLTGLGFLLSYQLFGLSVELFTAIVLFSLFVIITVTDCKYMLIPNRLLLFFIPFFLTGILLTNQTSILFNLLGAIIGYFMIALIILISRGGMGAGDMKLLGILGFVTGYPNVFSVLFLASFFGLITAMLLLLFRQTKTVKNLPVPFGPSLVLAAYIIFLSEDYWIFTFY